MDDVSVRLEHVDLLNGLDRLDVHLLERGLELLVVGTAVPGDLLDLSSGGTLASAQHQLLAHVHVNGIFLFSRSVVAGMWYNVGSCDGFV